MNFYGKPDVSEHTAYMKRYIDLVPQEHICTALEESMQASLALFSGLRPEQWNHRYAEGKWSCKDILGHMIDCERVFAYRAMCFARGERQPLPGFEENDYVENGGFALRSAESLLEEYHLTRRSSLAFFNGLEAGALLRTGIANGNNCSVRALGYVMAGHDLHHLQVIRERYL